MHKFKEVSFTFFSDEFYRAKPEGFYNLNLGNARKLMRNYQLQFHLYPYHDAFIKWVKVPYFPKLINHKYTTRSMIHINGPGYRTEQRTANSITMDFGYSRVIEEKLPINIAIKLAYCHLYQYYLLISFSEVHHVGILTNNQSLSWHPTKDDKRPVRFILAEVKLVTAKDLPEDVKFYKFQHTKFTF